MSKIIIIIIPGNEIYVTLSNEVEQCKVTLHFSNCSPESNSDSHRYIAKMLESKKFFLQLYIQACSDAMWNYFS